MHYSKKYAPIFINKLLLQHEEVLITSMSAALGKLNRSVTLSSIFRIGSHLWIIIQVQRKICLQEINRIKI